MKKLLSILLAAAFAISAADAPRVPRTTLYSLEKNLDDRLQRMWSDHYAALVGNSRGVYLPGYGVVLTAEVNLAPSNISMMNPTITEAEKVALRKKKTERVGQLRKSLKEILAAYAVNLDMIPAGEKVSIALILPRYTWEDATVVPLQMVAEGTRQQLQAAQKTGPAAIETAAKVSEGN
jgi:hypothetical protein